MNRINPIHVYTNPQPIPSVFNEGWSQYETIEYLVGLTDTLIANMNLGSDEIEELKNKKLTLEVYLDDVRNKRKIDDNANFTGSWFGIKKPVLIEGGIDGVVELLQKTIETLSKNGLIVDNVTDFVNDFKNICQSNSTIIIPNGIYEIKSYCLIENLENLTIEFRDNAILKDMCKDILLTDGTLGKVPYGIEFKNCNNLKIKGLRHTNILTPSSKKVSDGSISERTPNISFTNCNNLDVSLSFEGLTGLSNDSIFSDSYAVGKNYNDVLFARLSLMYCRFFNCSNVKIHDVKIGMIAGENIGIGNCNFVDFYQNSHFGNDLTNDVYGIWSFAKIINSNNVNINNIKSHSLSNVSFIDICGKNIKIENIDIEHVNGKLIDITNEWGVSNVDTENVVIKNCTSSGSGIRSIFTTTKKLINHVVIDNVIPFFNSEPTALNETFCDGINFNTLEIRNIKLKNFQSLVYEYVTDSDRDFYKSVVCDNIDIVTTKALSNTIFSIEAYGDTLIRNSKIDLNGLNELNIYDRYASYKNLTDLTTSISNVKFENVEFRNCKIRVRCNVKFINCKFYNCSLITYNSLGVKPSIDFKTCCFEFTQNNPVELTGLTFNISTAKYMLFDNCIFKGVRASNSAKYLLEFSTITAQIESVKFINCEFDYKDITTTTQVIVSGRCLFINNLQMINDFQLIGCIFNDTSNIFRGTALTSPTAFTSLTIKDCSFNVGSFVCQSNPNNNFNGLNAYIVHNLFKTLAVNTIFTTAGAVFNVLKLSNNIDINS